MGILWFVFLFSLVEGWGCVVLRLGGSEFKCQFLAQQESGVSRVENGTENLAFFFRTSNTQVILVEIDSHRVFRTC